ncbi:MAG: YkgJ family cysteine cluster protein [Aquificota bacterium]|nr:YkgJ family cysteine cluster protein [Aquificota bacterium]
MNEIPCPFLDKGSGSCRVYQARPLMCRLTLYKDRNTCEEDWKNPLSFLWRREISPFIEGIKNEFHRRWSTELRSLEEEFPTLI